MEEEQTPEAMGDTLTDEQRKALAVGQCNYMLLALLSVTALVCGNNAAWTCNFAERRFEYNDGYGVSSTCAAANFTNDFDTQLCTTLISQHGVGFYHWYGTVPVDTKICISYTLLFPWGWITPSFDTAFNAAQAFSVLANIFGAFAWFTLLFATCCPITQDRIKGLSCYYSMACICQSFTFLLYASNICEADFFKQYFPHYNFDNSVKGVTCSLGMGAQFSIAATVLYFVCSGLAPVSVAPPPLGYQRHYYQQQAQREMPPPPTTNVPPPAESPAAADDGADPEKQEPAAEGE